MGMTERPELRFYQAAAVALDEWACGYSAGRSKKDPVYLSIVENRDVPATYKSYSSCADRAHWRMWRLGCRLPFVNREERTPLLSDWRNQMNIAWLHDLSRGSPAMFKVDSRGRRFPVPPGKDWIPSSGDEMITWSTVTGSDAHSLSILSWDGKVARTANYGAGGMSASLTGARIVDAPLWLDGSVWRYGKNLVKPVQRVLRLEDAIPTFTAPANLEGPDFTADFTGEVRDLIERFVPGP